MEFAALAGHLLLYPYGLTPEQLPALPSPSGNRNTTAPPAAGSRTGTPAGEPRPHCAHLPEPGGESFSASEPDYSPVVLLHGLIDNRSVFTLLRQNLLRHGWTRVHCVNYSPLTSDIRYAAADLGYQVERIRAAYGGERVAVIGHSLGGLIGRYYVQRLAGDEHVHSLITLGTPHSGTHLARLPHLLPIVRQMRPGSSLLTELRAPAPGCRTRFTSIRGGLDELVLPGSSARIEHPDLAVRNLLVPRVGHLALPVHYGTMALVREALATGYPTAPAARAPRREAAPDRPAEATGAA
ncbi:lipase family alpha/beta hydrolase [Phaeacidiphilus oryzae]|uniref:lipase family alpha/beta hydrolase n=1 Tax=Phaeacidiphilus oryzae TaxID=348818 RepID=UPI001F1BD6A6|nr:alpha/beta fold hydrolase [Phaeacidiphilus oryzae]